MCQTSPECAIINWTVVVVSGDNWVFFWRITDSNWHFFQIWSYLLVSQMWETLNVGVICAHAQVSI